MNGALARRYASALADVALVEKNADQTKHDFDIFVEAFYDSADLRHFLESPVVSPEAKRRVVEHLAQRMNLMPAVRNFIYLIVDHRRTEALREIAQALREELNSRLGVAEAQVTSAHPLSALEKQQLTAALATRTGKKIEAHFEEDALLLGGAVVRVGSTVYDGSVREQLNRLREQLETE